MTGTVRLPRITFWRIVFWFIMAAAVYATYVRFVDGLGSSTNLSDEFPWGLWIGFDVLCGVALAAGGFTLAATVHIFNIEKYKPIVRPAILTAFLGYLLVVVALMFDLGRPYRIWHPLIMWNPHSVMFEVAACITAYILVMWIEFSPVVLEKFGLKVARRKLERFLFFIIALGVLLPMMHQSSLGSMLIIMGGQVHPLWQTPLQGLIYLLTAIVLGWGVVLFESCVAAAGYRRSIEVHLLNPLAKIMLALLALYLVVRVADLLWRGVAALAFEPTWAALWFWIENLAFLAPFVLIARVEQRRNPARLFLAGVAVMAGGTLLRLNGYLITFNSGPGWNYFPALTEVAVTAGFFAIEVLGYIVITRRFPVLPREQPAT